MTIAERALEMIRDGTVIGLGTGRAATAFVKALGPAVRAGLRITGVPTSEVTAGLARELGIPLTTLDLAGELDITFDGADEVAPNLNLIKGYGGALVREKIVAASSKRFVVLIGPEKEVSHLGEHGKLPVEVVPFALPLARRKLELLGLPPVLRLNQDGTPYVTDNGNPILDCKVGPIDDAAALEHAILYIPGVVGTGLFVDMAETVLIQNEDGTVSARHRVDA
ncbi:ribose-5-phosphate isomerase RpiA [Tundrisphaera lichenicola]|uniref:ribose-5-phosphate isomerase RpiA n=1 Tax=Tundrisphaera lichenicola TaxID=2029860 RepID=UPI003EBB082F